MEKLNMSMSPRLPGETFWINKKTKVTVLSNCNRKLRLGIEVFSTTLKTEVVKREIELKI